MKADRIGLLPSDLLDFARARDPSVSARQLARWHQKGLLPSPTQHGLGRGRGSIVLYPSGTRRQLERLLELKGGDPRLLTAGWQLWWEGYDVPNYVWHPVLLRFADDFSNAMNVLAVNGLKSSVTDEDDFEIPMPELSDLKYESTKNKMFRRIRKKFDSGKLETFTLLMVRIAQGEWAPENIGDDNDEDRLRDHEILVRGFGIHSTFPRSGVNSDTALDYLWLEPILQNLSRERAGGDIKSAVRDASRDDIEAAKAELCALFEPVDGGSLPLQVQPAVHTKGADMLRILASASPETRAHMLCLWISIGKSSPLRSAARAFLQELKTKHAR